MFVIKVCKILSCRERRTDMFVDTKRSNGEYRHAGPFTCFLNVL